MDEFLRLDLAPLLTVSAAAALLALLGSLLVLDRRALIGDAMAHSVLPGLVVAFAWTGSRAPLPMFVGALAAALLAALASHAIQRYGRTDPTAAIGVVFTTLFALGVALVEFTDARNVDLDLDCVLSGQLELLFWTPPASAGSLELVASLPRETRTLGVLALLVPTAIAWFWSPIRATLFDTSFARVAGGRPGLVRPALLAATTLVLVASFEALGAILVIALLTCPAAAARLFAPTMGRYVLWSAGRGLAAARVGYALSAWAAPATLGHSIDASGAVATTAGLVLAALAVARGARSARPVALDPKPDR